MMERSSQKKVRNVTFVNVILKQEINIIFSHSIR